MPRHNAIHRNSTSSDAAASDDLNSSSSIEDLCNSTYTVATKNQKKSSRSRQRQRQAKRKIALNQSNNSNNNNNNNNHNNHNHNNNNNNVNYKGNHKGNNNIDCTPMDIDDDTKENQRPINDNNSQRHHHQNYNKNHNNNNNNNNNQNNGKGTLNLRKQTCNKATTTTTMSNTATAAAATTAKYKGVKSTNIINNQNLHHQSNQSNLKRTTNVLTQSGSASSVCSSLSSASSNSSISSSSSSSTSSNSTPNSANSSPTASPTAAHKRTTAADNFKKTFARTYSPNTFRQNFTNNNNNNSINNNIKLNLPEHLVAQYLSRYVIDANLLRVYGFPIESAVHEGCIEVYRCMPKTGNAHFHHHINTNDYKNTTYNSNADVLKGKVINISDNLKLDDDDNDDAIIRNPDERLNVLNSHSHSDSGQGSDDSSPQSVDSDVDSSEGGEDEQPSTTCTTAFYTPEGTYQLFSNYDESVEKQCVRCKTMFHVTQSGEYISRDECIFHWGKMNYIYMGKNGFGSQWTCCHGDENSKGCTRNMLHVWTGAVVGLNGPYTDFIHTRPRPNSDKNCSAKVYAMDCEMSFTARGLDVTKVTVVGYDGQMVYEHFVRPEAEIVDYNTRFSGVTENDLRYDSNKSVKTLQEVQHDLLQLFDADTILIGHALDNDLRALRIVHKTVVDTSVTFPHASGFPYRRSLKHLTRIYLNRDIQNSDTGHSSYEDSRACLELMLWKLQKDLRNEHEYHHHPQHHLHHHHHHHNNNNNQITTK